jgi:DNA-binding GntR family transcriptional regulator
VRYLTVHDPERMQQILAEHREIVAALMAGDAEQAQAALRGHLRQVFVSVAKLGLSDEPSPPPRRRRPAGRAT